MSRKRSTTRLRIRGAVLALAAILTVPVIASDARERGRCVSTDLSTALVLPDGTRHDDARRLKVCLRARLSPTSDLHEIRVDGHPIGLFRSEASRSEDRAELTGAVVVFERAAARSDDSIAVWGYAVQEGERLRIFRLEHDARTPGM